MDLKIFAMVNVPFKSVEGVFAAPSFSLAVRDNFQNWLNIYPNLLDDYQVYEIGSITREVSDVGPCSFLGSTPFLMNWSDYDSEMEYVPRKLSLRQQDIMRKSMEQQLGSIQQIQERMDTLQKMQKINYPVGDIKEEKPGVAPNL